MEKIQYIWSSSLADREDNKENTGAEQAAAIQLHSSKHGDKAKCRKDRSAARIFRR